MPQPQNVTPPPSISWDPSHTDSDDTTPFHLSIYESSSRGGCYKYALELFHAYRKHPKVTSVTLLLPKNSEIEGDDIEKCLLSDGNAGNRWHFLYRHFINPFILFFYLRKQRKLQSTGKMMVLLNDFEQMSAPLWAPLYRLFLKNTVVAVFLHDADRDAYPPSRAISGFCMSQMMKAMHLALYHGTLPHRTYYASSGKTNYLKVEHGLYTPAPPDAATLEEIATWKKTISGQVFIIPGHIRIEKNYILAIRALEQLPAAGLIIAGSPSSSSVTTTHLRKLADDLGISDRILWLERYLTEEEMTAALQSADIVLLYYSSGFHAQSGILNQVAPLQKPVITGNLPNALTASVEKYRLGWVVPPDDGSALLQAMKTADTSTIQPCWATYFEDVDWGRQADSVVNLMVQGLEFRV
jgi:glycosyltransferase involved in cell wall biosynthesis